MFNLEDGVRAVLPSVKKMVDYIDKFHGESIVLDHEIIELPIDSENQYHLLLELLKQRELKEIGTTNFLIMLFNYSFFPL